ncbi:MAG: dihydropteroate synthase, partial [Novosphingobium sp.]|nr:dihydropteroate synthase [Novosphingobium sp.]
MAQKLYIRPIALADSPQSEEGAAIRLAGGLVYASRFALILREGSKVLSRRRFAADEAGDVLGALPDALAAEAAAQWSNLRAQHAPLTCGARMLRLDQPQVMGILNVTPDSFSDGGKFLDKPEAALE